MKNLYIILFALLITACGKEKDNTSEVIQTDEVQDNITITQAQFESENMAFGSLEEFDFNEGIKANGMIDVPPQNKSSISTFIGGYITKTPLLIGSEVKKGQLLVTLQNPEYVEIQQNYLEVAEQLNYLKSEFNRQKTLFDEQITSEKNYLKAESTYKSNLAHYNGLRKKLQMIHISPQRVEQGTISSSINLYAPIDGFVTKVNVSNGTYVSPSDVILEIVDTHHVHLELSVFEKDIMAVKKGQKIRFQIPEASDQTFNADVHLVGTTIDGASRRVQVHGHIDNEDDNFIVGMFVDAEIITENTKRIGLPKEAIISLEGDSYILVLETEENNEFHLQKVKLTIGKETEDVVEVLNSEALKNKQILVKGIGMLLNESEGGHSH
ncbi:efflux RND transporter periplasmic adaptor subunit [Winogradskyella thalassocola]|uniref:Membrane fusion protein, cobalt-zinc-cadmium efflux system n=1 Tax=Winogradskyella thalassocola TaxID=262004 RepID=A0A1G7XVX3_9FLAO|nr:efflux RND transporter periplasmic adaptor subunit [Winogradskyella thalassocola]SDG88358.1 membrane fusion protein, cobalt-zinc-cadmium efflux system [Winogradskyella thalassocola]